MSHGRYYDDARAIDLSFDSESIPIDPEALAADQEDFFAPPSDTTEAKGSFELVNNEYVYKDDSKSSTSPRATISKVDNSQFADLKPKTAPQDEADRAMLRADKALANELSDAMDFDQFEDETDAPKVEAKSKEELDFAKDLQAILSGEKIYDPESKDLVEHKREVTLDGEESEATPTETHKPKQSTEQEALKANNSSDPYDIFNQIENNRGTREVINSESEELSVFDEVPPMVSAHSKNTIVNIEVLEQTTAGMDNGFLPQRATAVEGELRASSVSDMVQKVLAHLKDGQKIGRLIISGHGAKGNISVGAGQGSINGKEINGDSKHWKTELAKLKDKFDPNKGELFLRGCNVGAGQAGSKKLQELADFLNIRVFAPTGKVYHSKEEAGSVHQVAKPGATAPAPIGTPSEVKIAKKSSAHALDNSSMLFKDLEEIKFYTGHHIDKGISAKDADVVETASSWIKGFQTQLTVSDPDQLKGLAAKINGVVFLTRGGNQQKLLIYDDFHHLVDEDFSLSYELSPILRAQIIEVFQPNLSLMSSMPEALGTKTEVDITIIDHNNDGFLGGSALLTLGELRGASVKDSIDKILGHLEEGQKIRKLTIIGHGNKGLIIMGSAKKREKISTSMEPQQIGIKKSLDSMGTLRKMVKSFLEAVIQERENWVRYS